LITLSHLLLQETGGSGLPEFTRTYANIFLGEMPDKLLVLLSGENCIRPLSQHRQTSCFAQDIEPRINHRCCQTDGACIPTRAAVYRRLCSDRLGRRLLAIKSQPPTNANALLSHAADCQVASTWPGPSRSSRPVACGRPGLVGAVSFHLPDSFARCRVYVGQQSGCRSSDLSPQLPPIAAIINYAQKGHRRRSWAPSFTARTARRDELQMYFRLITDNSRNPKPRHRSLVNVWRSRCCRPTNTTFSFIHSFIRTTDGPHAPMRPAILGISTSSWSMPVRQDSLWQYTAAPIRCHRTIFYSVFFLLI